ncbi:MAG: YHS domain-containing protein [Planctomycetaceae bacterium]
MKVLRDVRSVVPFCPLLIGCCIAAVVALTVATQIRLTAADSAKAGATDATTDSKSAKEAGDSLAESKTALAEFNSLIGQWRGVGMPKRNSQDGAWSETAEWVWHFDKTQATIDFKTKDGKLLESGKLAWNAKAKNYRLTAVAPDKTQRDYAGKLVDGKVVLDSQPDKSGYVHRLTLTRLNPKRTIVLLEKKPKDSSFFNRVAEIGYTRQGTSLAVAGSNEPQCVVTGGKGTMTVSYQGQTYYVCCSGCKQAFEDDPEGIIADYKKRIAKAKAEREK